MIVYIKIIINFNNEIEDKGKFFFFRKKNFSGIFFKVNLLICVFEIDYLGFFLNLNILIFM